MRDFVFWFLTVLNLKNIQSHSFYYAPLYFSAFALLKTKILVSENFVFFDSTALYCQNTQSHSFYYAPSSFFTQALKNQKILASENFVFLLLFVLNLKNIQMRIFRNMFYRIQKILVADFSAFVSLKAKILAAKFLKLKHKVAILNHQKTIIFKQAIGFIFTMRLMAL